MWEQVWFYSAAAADREAITPKIGSPGTPTPHGRTDGGRRVRLAGTELIIEVEAGRTIDDHEVKFGGGKVIGDGMPAPGC